MENKEVTILSNEYSLRMVDDDETQSLSIVKPSNNLDVAYIEYPNNTLSRSLFKNFGLMHLVANSFPNVIRINFLLIPEVFEIVQAMYAFNKRAIPKIKYFDIEQETTPNLLEYKLTDRKAVVAFSGGKDSLWNVWRMTKSLGIDNVLAVHIAGINRSVSAQEEKDTLAQRKTLRDFPQLKIVKLKNGSRISGKSVMRSRDMFITSLIIPIALDFGASRIVIEGNMGKQDQNYQFTETESSWKLYNKKIEELIGSPIKVEWEDADDVECLADLIKYWPRSVPTISNCFSPPFARKNLRKKWLEKTPNFILQNPSQCGSCIKCRIVRIAMALNNLNYPAEEVIFFLKDTKEWLKAKKDGVSDIIGQDFYSSLDKAIDVWDNLNN